MCGGRGVKHATGLANAAEAVDPDDSKQLVELLAAKFAPPMAYGTARFKTINLSGYIRAQVLL